MSIFEYGKAICYSGYRAGQSPKTAVPSAEEIAEDMEILAGDGYRYLRMYDPNLHARRVLETIRDRKLPMKCIIGIDSDPEVNNPNCPWEKQNYSAEQLQAHIDRNDGELNKLIDLVKEFDDEVIAVSVGNENTPSWGAHIVPEDRLIDHAKKLKAALNKPVTFCEGAFEWKNLSKLAAEVDFISIHSYPYHYGTDLDKSVALNKQQFEEIKALYPDKEVIFTEVGWSSDSTSQNTPARASLENAKAYITELTQWLEQDQVVAFLFEAFNEPWKGDSVRSSECNFGLYTVDRIKKW